MYPQTVASLGMLLIGMVASGLIYRFGARRIADACRRRQALQWTIAFALSICTFCGAAPFLIEQGTWVLLFPFLGIGLSLVSIHEIAAPSPPMSSRQSTVR